MPKRSLQPGGGGPKNFEQLNNALDAMMARNDGRVSKAAEEIEPLVRIAAELRNLPSASFKARLKSELGGKKRMSTVAEPLATALKSAAPRLTFRDAAKAIEFYKEAFGATETFRFEVGKSIAHAEIAIGNSRVMLAEEWPEGGRFSAETLGSSPVGLVVEVADVDTALERAVAAGMKVARPITDQFYGHRDVLLADPFGYVWNVFTVKEAMSVEEMHRRMAKLPRVPQGVAVKPPSRGVDPVPRGFRMVTPYLVSADGPALIDFVKQAFEAEEMFRAETPMGGVHGELRIGDSMMMVGGGIPGKNFPGQLKQNALHVYVRDVDAVTAKAVAAGATLIDEARDQEYGERSSTVKDLAGNFWYIATYKGKDYKWEGAPDVQPYLHPRRAEPLINFLKRAFNAQEIGRYASPDGVVHHATLKIGDSHLEMGEAHDKYETMAAMFYLYVPDVDAVYKQAVAAGATSFQEPADQFYGDRSAGVRDAFGNTWYIATHIKDVAM